MLTKEDIKEMKGSEDIKQRISYWLAVAAFIVGCGLMIAGFIVSPVGEIAGSVIGGVGLLLSFTGAILGISFHYNLEDEKFKASVETRIDELLKKHNGTE